MPLPTHLILRVAACLSAVTLMAGCSSSDARARDALSDYQTASAANDPIGARKALMKLVRAKDDVPDYWVELGKLQVSMGSYNDAYYAFTRAYELDRNNVDILHAVTELALRSGDIALAQSHARELEVISPGDPWVKLTNGWAAFTESHFDQAMTIADSILANAPYDPAGTVLKARALLSLNRQHEAMDLLNKEMQAQPMDVSSRQLLAKIYVQQNNWGKVVEVAKPLIQANPVDQESALLLIEAALRAGNFAVARQASARILAPNSEPTTISSVLDLWANYWPSNQRIQDARALASKAAGRDQKLVYAAFLSRAGDPTAAIAISTPDAGLPLRAENSEANAVLADAWSRSGNMSAAKSRFDAVIAFDPGNATALRGRAELELRTGNAAAAIMDAQKLTTVLPNSSRDRLLLARCYSAAGNKAWVDRTLWSAFQAIPADENIYAALQLTRKGNNDATRELQEEFDRQRNAKIYQGLL
jgi:predicted Zn-dependent protease